MIVTVDEVKTHLRIEHNEEDSYIEGLIKQAQAEAEDYCRVSFEEPDEEGNIPDVPEPVRLAVILMTSFYYENRDIPDMTTYKATRMAFDNLLYRYRDPDGGDDPCEVTKTSKAILTPGNSGIRSRSVIRRTPSTKMGILPRRMSWSAGYGPL